MLEQLATTIEQHKLLEPHATYIVAVSGGVDSIVLLDALTRLSEDWGWKLIVAHLDHAQRPESADEAMRVGAMADQKGHRFLVNRLNAEQQSEGKMRQARLAWLEAMRNEQDAAAILTAHHQDDRLETAIWHAIRGSGRHGLTSLKARQGKIIRPLIGFRRGDILTYAALRDLDWIEDPSNATRDYMRNVIRHELLHKAPLQDPHYQHNLSDWLDHLEGLNTRIDRLLDALVGQIAQRSAAGWQIDRTMLLRQSEDIQREIILHLARALNSAKGVTQHNIAAARHWVEVAPTGSFSEALPGLILIREYDKVSLVTRDAPASILEDIEHRALGMSQPVKFGRFELTVKDAEDAVESAYRMIPGAYFVRSWQAGDRVRPLGMSGTKKVQDIFVDKKVSRQDRLVWPVIVSGSNDIALIPGLVRDRRFMAEPGGKEIAVEVKEV